MVSRVRTMLWLSVDPTFNLNSSGCSDLTKRQDQGPHILQDKLEKVERSKMLLFYATFLFILLTRAQGGGLEYFSVSIGGGGYVTSILSTPLSAAGSAAVFFRTDVGASYRMNNSTGSIMWEPLFDFLSCK